MTAGGAPVLPARPVTQDEQHLQLLAVFHHVVAGMTALFSLFPILHLALGVAMVTGRLETDSRDPFAAVMGWFFILFALAWIVCGLAFAVLLVRAGLSLSRQRHYMFCMVMAGIACVFIPFGTVLGVLTLIVLSRPQVREMFAERSPGGAAPPAMP